MKKFLIAGLSCLAALMLNAPSASAAFVGTSGVFPDQGSVQTIRIGCRFGAVGAITLAPRKAYVSRGVAGDNFTWSKLVVRFGDGSRQVFSTGFFGGTIAGSYKKTFPLAHRKCVSAITVTGPSSFKGHHHVFGKHLVLDVFVD